MALIQCAVSPCPDGEPKSFLDAVLAVPGRLSQDASDFLSSEQVGHFLLGVKDAGVALQKQTAQTARGVAKVVKTAAATVPATITGAKDFVSGETTKITFVVISAAVIAVAFFARR